MPYGRCGSDSKPPLAGGGFLVVSLTDTENHSQLADTKKTPDPEAWCGWRLVDRDGRHSVQWDAQSMGSPCG
jgi:hypothetical protein